MMVPARLLEPHQLVISEHRRPLPVLTGAARRHWIVVAGLPTSTAREFFVINQDTDELVAAACKHEDAVMIASVMNVINDVIAALHIAGNTLDDLIRGHDLDAAQLIYSRFAAHVTGTILEDASKLNKPLGSLA